MKHNGMFLKFPEKANGRTRFGAQKNRMIRDVLQTFTVNFTTSG